MSVRQDITVYDKRGNRVRTYNIKDHGKGFIDLAKQFAKKNGYRLDPLILPASVTTKSKGKAVEEEEIEETEEEADKDSEDEGDKEE